MYPDLDQTEVVFVHKLASGEPTARSRALKKLHAFVKQRSEEESLSHETFNRLSKGLHYAMWMQDKPILQQELAANIASLIDDFNTHQEGALFVKIFFQALSTQWHLVDRWRMDKFLMMARIMIRKTFSVMSTNQWSAEITNTYLSALKETMINSQSSIVQSLKTHFASVYLDELSKTGTVTKAISQQFIEPYLEILQENRATDFFFKSICDEIFQTLIYTASEEIRKGDMEKEDDGDENDEEDDADDIIRLLRIDNPIPCDFDKLGDRLFAIGSQPTVNSKRRQRLYALSKKFKAIVQGKNPQPEPMKVSDKPAISKAKMHKAAERLLGMQEKLQMDRQKFKMQMKELKKKQNAEKIADILSGLVSTKKPVKKIKSSNKFKPNAVKKKGHHKSTSATASRRHKLPSKGKISKKQRQ
jgi:ribosomal RNA-processing protein 1